MYNHFGYAQPQNTFEQMVLAGCNQKCVDPPYDIARLFKKRFPRRGQSHRPGIAVQKANAQLAF